VPSLGFCHCRRWNCVSPRISPRPQVSPRRVSCFIVAFPLYLLIAPSNRDAFFLIFYYGKPHRRRRRWNFAMAYCWKFCRQRRWNFAVGVIGILPSPSLEFCHQCRWNFAVAVFGTLEYCQCRHCQCHCWNLPSPSLPFLPVPSLEFCHHSCWNFAMQPLKCSLRVSLSPHPLSFGRTPTPFYDDARLLFFFSTRNAKRTTRNTRRETHDAKRLTTQSNSLSLSLSLSLFFFTLLSLDTSHTT
jgi:hypothetical protein